MNETKILSACLKSRQAYESIAGIQDTEDFTPMGQYWWKQLDAYYMADCDASSVDTDLLLERGLRDVNDNQRSTVADYYSGIPINGEAVSSINVVKDLFSIRRQGVGMGIAQMLINPEAIDPSELQAAMESYQNLTLDEGEANGEAQFVGWTGLSETTSRENAIKLAPQKLNDRLRGGAIAGDHVFIFGRPEVGKSLFAINMAAKCAKLGHKVLYLGNEEPIERTMQRMACNLSGATIQQFDEKPAEVEAAAIKRGIQNIYAKHLAPGSLKQVETLVASVKPAIVFIDQLSGLDHPDPNEFSKVGKLARGFRSIVQRHKCIGVSIGQAGDKTDKHGQEVPAYLSMSDVFGSRTPIQAQCDLMIGVGTNAEMLTKGMRAVTLVKNKLGGDHSPFMVHYDEQRSRVT
jgi:archaellum biogenesis ATPase FlaH